MTIHDKDLKVSKREELRDMAWWYKNAQIQEHLLVCTRQAFYFFMNPVAERVNSRVIVRVV